MECGQTKQKLFDEAVRLFAERGYKEVSMREIGKAAGISEPAVYRHFENKEEILNDILFAFKLKLQSYLLTKSHVDRYIETDTPRQLLERCAGSFTKEDTVFMARGYRIVCMEQFKNPFATELIKTHLLDAPTESIQYVLDSLIARNLIPPYDTKFISKLWTQFMFAGALIWMMGYYDGNLIETIADDFKTMAAAFVEMALTGSIPTIFFDRNASD